MNTFQWTASNTNFGQACKNHPVAQFLIVSFSYKIIFCLRFKLIKTLRVHSSKNCHALSSLLNLIVIIPKVLLVWKSKLHSSHKFMIIFWGDEHREKNQSALFIYFHLKTIVNLLSFSLTIVSNIFGKNLIIH